jgi:hypothetical protein
VVASFAALEARVNNAVLSRLANMNAILNGSPVAGIFDNTYNAFDMGGSLAGASPLFTLPTASVPGVVVGLALVVNGTTYQVVNHEPDGTGLSILRLRT